MSTHARQLIIPELIAEAPRADAWPSARALHGSIWLASLGVLAVAALLEVRQQTMVTIPLLDYTLPELCYWRTMFGMDCPGCGLTRCFISAAHGQHAEAWHYNPMGLLLFGVLVLQVPYRPWQLWRLATGRGEYQTVGLPYAMLGVSVLLILQWFWRLLS